jgi:hypothetical protein
MRKTLLGIALLVVALPLSAGNATVKDVGTGTFQPNELGRLDDYAKLAATSPDDLAEAIESDLTSRTVIMSNGARFVFDANPYYSVVFVATPPGATDPKIYRLLLHVKSAGKAEIVDHLPGVTDFYEIFLSEDPDATIDTVFSAAAVANPIEAQVLKTVKFTEEGFAALIGHKAKTDAKFLLMTPLPNPPSPPVITVMLRSVHVTDARSMVSVNTTISPAVETDRATLKTAVGNTTKALLRTKALISPCAMRMATDLATVATDALNKKPDHERVNATERNDIRNLLRAKIDFDLTDLSDCKANADAQNGDARVTAISDTENAYLGLFKSDEKPLTSSDSFADTPLAHFDLGVAAGAMLRIRGAERAKLNDTGDKAISDPLTGVLSMAALHWHPVAFDPATATPTAPERASIVFGFVVKPEPGLAAGLSWSIFRGLNVHVSYAWMLVHEARPIPDAANPPKDLLRRGWSRALVVGFGYNFE